MSDCPDGVWHLRPGYFLRPQVWTFCCGSRNLLNKLRDSGWISDGCFRKVSHSSKKKVYMDVSKNRGKPPKWMVKIMENPIEMDDLGVPLFSETPIYIICIQIICSTLRRRCESFVHLSYTIEIDSFQKPHSRIWVYACQGTNILKKIIINCSFVKNQIFGGPIPVTESTRWCLFVQQGDGKGSGFRHKTKLSFMLNDWRRKYEGLKHIRPVGIY